jgi:hypothetical protein
MSQPFRELCATRNHGEFGMKSITKALENIAHNPGGQGTVAWVAPSAGLTEIQQNRTCLQIPAQSRLSKSSRSIRFLLQVTLAHFGKEEEILFPAAEVHLTEEEDQYIQRKWKVFQGIQPSLPVLKSVLGTKASI